MIFYARYKKHSLMYLQMTNASFKQIYFKENRQRNYMSRSIVHETKCGHYTENVIQLPINVLIGRQYIKAYISKTTRSWDKKNSGKLIQYIYI